MTQRVELPDQPLDPQLRERLQALHDEGRAIFDRFEREVRSEAFHPFKPADYTSVVNALLPLRGACRTFLEWGSATGVIAITADLLGFEAYGIEIDADLVETARELARRHGSTARFAAGSMLPRGYEWRTASGDTRLGTIEPGDPGYAELGLRLNEFDLVYGYPWSGEDVMMYDLMRRCAREGARLMLNGGSAGISVFVVRDGRLVPQPAH